MRAGTTAIILQWDASPGATSYRVYQATGTNYFSPISPDTMSTAVAYGTDLSVLTRWFVTALNPIGQSEPSNVVTNFPVTPPSTNPPPTVIPPPTDLRATLVFGSRVDLSYNNSPDLWTVFERAVNGGAFVEFATESPGTLHTTVRVKKNVTFEFRCRARDSAGRLSAFSNSVIIYAQ